MRAKGARRQVDGARAVHTVGNVCDQRAALMRIMPPSVLHGALCVNGPSVN